MLLSLGVLLNGALSLFSISKPDLGFVLKVFGEVGLSGEVRHVSQIEKRIAEANKLGFDGAVGPTMKSNKKPKNLTSVSDVRTALNTFLEKS